MEDTLERNVRSHGREAMTREYIKIENSGHRSDAYDQRIHKNRKQWSYERSL